MNEQEVRAVRSVRPPTLRRSSARVLRSALGALGLGILLGWGPMWTTGLSTHPAPRSSVPVEKPELPPAVASHLIGRMTRVEEKAGSEPIPAPSPSGPPLAGRTVLVDPGHNGANGEAPEVVNAQVPDGRGGVKACNTTGTSTNDGYPEHAFAWDVAQRVRVGLEERGATVVLTRDSDDGVGPCVDRRGALAEESDADLMVSVHGNGSTDPTVRGYFAIVADPPLDGSLGEDSLELARSLLDELGAEGFTPNPGYPEALSRRPDITGLNFATRPAVLLELGEMRNIEEAAVMMSEEGRQRYADVIVVGIEQWLVDR